MNKFSVVTSLESFIVVIYAFFFSFVRERSVDGKRMESDFGRRAKLGNQSLCNEIRWPSRIREGANGNELGISRFKRHVGRDYAIISGVHGEREILTRIVTPAITLERKGTTGAIVGPWHEMFSVLNRQTCPLPPLLPEIFARYLGEVKVVITAP